MAVHKIEIVQNATAYLLNTKGEIHETEVGSNLYIEAKVNLRPFVIATSLSNETSYSINIPYTYLEALSQEALRQLHEIVVRLSGKGKPEEFTAKFDVINLSKGKVEPVANELL